MRPPADDGRWLVVDGRRWRRQDPALPEDVARRLLSHLGRGRAAVRALRRGGEDPAPARRRVDLAKHGLGERGTPWWEQGEDERRTRWETALAELDGLDGLEGPGGPTGQVDGEAEPGARREPELGRPHVVAPRRAIAVPPPAP